MSTGTVISEHARKPDPYEPDDQWKAKVKEKLSPGFNDMLLQSKRRLERDLKRFGEDKIDPAERQRLIGNYLASEHQIKDSETESFRVQVENEREQRRRASEYGLPVERREDLRGELGPMSGIGGQRSGADSGEAPAESPARSPDSQKQMATVKLMCVIAPASVATRPSPIPSSTPKDSGIFLLWTKPAVDDKLTPLGRRTSQASPRTSSPQIFRPAPIPEGSVVGVLRHTDHRPPMYGPGPPHTPLHLHQHHRQHRFPIRVALQVNNKVNRRGDNGQKKQGRGRRRRRKKRKLSARKRKCSVRHRRRARS